MLQSSAGRAFRSPSTVTPFGAAWLRLHGHPPTNLRPKSVRSNQSKSSRLAWHTVDPRHFDLGMEVGRAPLEGDDPSKPRWAVAHQPKDQPRTGEARGCAGDHREWVSDNILRMTNGEYL